MHAPTVEETSDLLHLDQRQLGGGEDHHVDIVPGGGVAGEEVVELLLPHVNGGWDRSASVDSDRIGSQPLTVVNADTHWSYGTQVLPRSSPQSRTGVFQKLIAL